MSPASRAPLIYNGHRSQDSQSLALGLAKTAATQLVAAAFTSLSEAAEGAALQRETRPDGKSG